MTAGRNQRLFQRLRQAALAREEGGPTDGDLLNRFVARRDGDALEALIRRHGPMVLAVCRRVLSQEQDAEDAFQAAFLVFVRKAASIRARELVGNWLYGVAYRTALKARTAAARRRVNERQAAIMAGPRIESEADWSELLPLLDQELNRLPEKYRIAIILCELEGRPRREAARRLGVPEGTLSSRLATGRRMLARRLARHGPAPSAGALAAALAHGATAPVAPPLLASTVKAASLVAAGQAAAAVVSLRVAALAEGVIKTMLLAKLTTTATLLAAVAVVAFGVAVLAFRAPAAEPAAPGRTPPAVPAATNTPADKPEAKKVQSEWGEAVDGLQARLRPTKTAWDLGEAAEFVLDIRNRGEKAASQCRVPNYCEIEWDGKWYEYGGSGELDCKAYSLDPGKQIDQWVKASLDTPWVRTPDRIVGEPPTIGSVVHERLQVAPGKHTVRVAFVFDAGLRVVSRPADIEVGKESVWGESSEGVQARLRTAKAVWKAGESPTFTLDLRNRGKQTPHAMRIPLKCEIEVDGTWYHHQGLFAIKMEDTPLEPGKEIDDWVEVTPTNAWVWKPPEPAAGPYPSLALSPGKHTIRITFPFPDEKPSIRPVSGPVEIEVGKEAAWGEAVDGVQARLRPAKAAWDEGESPPFLLDLRNQGKTAPSLCRLPQFCEVELDGKWYQWAGAVAIDRLSSPLKPGDEVDACVTLSLGDPWVLNTGDRVPGAPIGDKEVRMKASAGKHTLRVAFTFDGRAVSPRPVSQSVEVEVGKESAWGDADGGVQARVRTAKSVWKKGEAPTFILDLRNQGKQTPHSTHVPFDCEIEVDGTWYAYTGPVDVASVDTRLDPDKQFNDWVVVSPDNLWMNKTPGPAPGPKDRLPLPPGKHTIRIAFPTFQGVKPGIRPVSGPVEITILEAKEK